MLDDEYKWVEGLTRDEKDALANMVMRSLRGNWNNPQERIRILEKVCKEGLHRYDVEEIMESVNHFKRMYFDGWHDGRIFRSFYQEGPELSDLVEQPFVERYASKLPHDMTWEAFTIQREFEGT